MSEQQQEQRGGWLGWLASSVLLVVLAAAMALIMVGGLLRTTITGPDWSLLSLCLHGAGWEGGLVESGTEEDEEGEEDEDQDSEEGESGEENEDGDQDPGTEEGDEEDSSEAEEDSGDGEGEGGPGGSPEPDEDTDGDGGTVIPELPHPDHDGDGGGGPEHWPDNPADWASVLPGQEAPGGVVRTVSLSAALAPMAPSSEGLWVPKDMLELYQRAGKHWKMDWWILASIGYHESRHGTDPSSKVPNEADALGPMQFVPSAWAHHGVYPDGREGTPPLEDRLDPATAVWSAANKLTDQGIRETPEEALHAYNRSWAYVRMIMDDAKRFKNGDYQNRDDVGVGDLPEAGGSSGGEGGLPPSLGTGTEADFENCWDLLSSILDDASLNGLAGGLVARAPDELTQAVVDWALAQKGKPYIWGGEGPVGYDCSGLTMMAYNSIGLGIPRVTHDQVRFGPTVDREDVQPGDLIFIDSPWSPLNNGPAPRHVGMVVEPEANLMIEAKCTLCGPIDVNPWNEADVYAFTRPLADPTAASLVGRAGSEDD